MIRIQHISTSDTRYHDYMERLLTASFPPDEYRDLVELRHHTDNRANFYNNIILDGSTPIGLVTYWDFGDFCYIEHLAIDPGQRNGGYGKKLLTHLSELLKRPIVLEVEPPTEEMAQRRINFYKRQGFVLWEKEYVQPPYRKDSKELPMYLMASGGLDCEKDFERVRAKLHQEVYNIRI